MATSAQHTSRHIVLASTTSPQNTGLLDKLISGYYKWTKLKDIRVDVVAVGTGAALEIASPRNVFPGGCKLPPSLARFG